MTQPSSVLYAAEPGLDVGEFCRVLLESGLGATRPTGDRARMQQMLDQADLVVTARLDRPDRALVGVARSITDFSWCCYLSELAVSSSAQGLGVGKGLIDATPDRAKSQPGASIDARLGGLLRTHRHAAPARHLLVQAQRIGQ